MRLHLVDRSEKLVLAWRAAFRMQSEVSIDHGDILAAVHTALVSPANSYGYMDGGIDRADRDFFGIQIEHAVQAKIKAVAGPYLAVGSAILVHTGHERIPHLITAPTMFLPEPIDAEACARAMRAALEVAVEHRLEHVFCPGMGTGVGRVAPEQAAEAMAAAYAAVSSSRPG